MSDRLDKELGRHIRAVFDAYEEPYEKAHWLRLQRKRRMGKLRYYLKWTGAAAAVACVLVTVAILWNRPGQEMDSLAGTANVKEERAADAAASTESGPATASTEAVSPGLPERPGPDQALPAGANPAVAAPADGAVAANSDPSADELSVAANSGPPAVSAGKPGAADSDSLADLVANSGSEEASALNADSAAMLAQNAGEHIVVAEDGTQNKTETALASTERMRNRAGAASPGARSVEESLVTNPAAKEADSRKGGKFHVGLVTTSLMNYADGNSSNTVHFGAGITSGWEINDRLSLHSGLVFTENSLSLDNSNSSVRAMDASPNFAPESELSLAGKSSVVRQITSNSMDVNLLVVDIPLNMTYRLPIGGSNLLLTGGLSSFAYLDQEYSYYSTMQLYNDNELSASEPRIRNEGAFSHFDFARQLNFAVGTEVPLGKSSFLIIEPYVKYPLGTLTSEQIRFGSAGMNLRLSFGD